jgi:hypothetical protein
MAVAIQPRIVMVDRTEEGIVVSFEDNRDAIFPASLLYSLLPHVQEIFGSEQNTDE